MQFTLKSGHNAGRRRIWIEGARLIDLGLTPKTRLTRVMEDADIGPDTMTLTTVSGIKGRRHSISGTADRPILDMCGVWVTDFMDGHSHFHVEAVTYSDSDGTYLDLVITPVNA